MVREKITYSNGQTHNLTFLYNGEGLTGFVLNNTLYTYRKNLFGDIIAIYQGNTKVAEYAYDAYGNCTIKLNTANVATLNPFRYRGYYFDEDMKLYYLQSRYYDPETGRFINADDVSYLDPETIHGLNLYAYCLNNPVMYVDPVGHFAISTFLITIAISSVVLWGLSEIFGAQVAGGISSVAGGGSAISTGISLFAFGPWGVIAGIALIAIGTATAIVGVNEIVDGATGINYIQQWTGMNDELYNGLYIGLNIVSSVGSIAGNIGMKYASTAKLNAVMKNPEIIQNYSKFQFKTYARYSNQWILLPSKNGKGMRALSLVNKGNSIRYGYGINNEEHFFGAYYWVVANGKGKYRFPLG